MAKKSHFIYDAFISYRQKEPDKTWVQKTLVPRLETEGFRICIDHRDFQLGRPLVQEMARAVEQSKYTIAILTSAYLESNFTELENILAEHLGLEKSQRRLLSIMRKKCEPHLRMRAHLWLDMTDNKEFDTKIAQLCDEIRKDPHV